MGVSSEYGLRFGRLDRGEKDLITDVAGVSVGHCTVRGEGVNTGVTALIPHAGDVFHEKLIAGAHVINGFGKSAGLVQVMELGTLETPLLFTNTFSVGECSGALISYMLGRNADIGVTTSTVNPVVFECNDGYLNDIRGMHVTRAHALSALASAARDFDEGAVGAGTGMSCFSLKGGIGSASRTFELLGEKHTLGALVLTNFGALPDLTVCGEHTGERIAALLESEANAGGGANGKNGAVPGGSTGAHGSACACEGPNAACDAGIGAGRDAGSVITVIATDVPLSSRQLTRAARRVQSGLSRTGGIAGNGSGEIALAFSTAQRVPHYARGQCINMHFISDDDMDTVFRAVIECTEEAVISSMLAAAGTHGVNGHARRSLAEFDWRRA